METVYTLSEAEEWFLSHAGGSVRCAKDGDSQTCSTYLEANRFFAQAPPNTTPDDDTTATGLGLMTGLALGESLSGIASADYGSDPSPSTDSTPDTSSGLDTGDGDFGGAGGGSDY
jgi:hypothetical protein